jgi:sugar/nucleoside kinase (ribokinase family)
MESNMVRIIAVGAAVQDVFLSGTIFTPHYEQGKWVEEFKVGEKYELEKVVFSTGGGATNAAVTFARQGMHAMFMGKIGDDPAGRAVLDNLHTEGVDTSLVTTSEHYHTGYSTLLLAPDGGRTILTYRGASSVFHVEDFDLENMHSDWLYVSSLAGNMEVLEVIINAAADRNIKIAINPGKGELSRDDELKKLLHKCELLSLNKEELQRLVEGDSDEDLVRHASDMTPITIMTDGPRGVTATDRKQIIKAGMYEDLPVIDRSGAGDAFGSGFTASMARGEDLASAVRFASANSTSVINKIGAKTGILHREDQLHDMPMDIKDF